jgi:hypothetical protein
VTAPHIAPSRLARAALAYAGRGWHIFPLLPKGKFPLIKGGGGFLSASCDPATVTSWWAMQPNANIGLWPGQSGLIVIDLDGPEGEATGRALGLLSEPTLQVVTGREDGGRHLYFKRPDFPISNANIGKKVDVRCDAGYVVLPPSIHPSGRSYAWVGKVDEIGEIPPRVLDVLRQAQAPTTIVGGGTSAKEIALEPEIGDGERNNSLTRYAGRLLAKGMSDDETLALVSALNQAKCKPPLPQPEINALVAGIARRESAKRATTTGQTLVLVQDPIEQETAGAVIAKQVEGARALLSRDISKAPRWGWPDVDALSGPMLPGDLLIVGALMGNGKSSLLMSQMDAFAREKVPTLYVPLEVDPEVCRLRWGAWRLNIDAKAALRQEWLRLPEGAREALDAILEEQEHDPYVHFASPKRITLPALGALCQWAKEQFGCRVVMLDHIHRMNFGGGGDGHRVAVTEAMRELKDLARDLGITLVAAAQLNRSSDPVDAYVMPLLSRLKESSAIAEEADVVLMLSRRLRQNKPENWNAQLRLGEITAREIAEPGVMVVTCRKHRMDDDSMDRTVLLNVVNGRIESRAPAWRIPPDRDSRWEPE